VEDAALEDRQVEGEHGRLRLDQRGQLPGHLDAGGAHRVGRDAGIARRRPRGQGIGGGAQAALLVLASRPARALAVARSGARRRDQQRPQRPTQPVLRRGTYPAQVRVGAGGVAPGGRVVGRVPKRRRQVGVLAECLQDQLLRLDRASIALGGPRGQQRGGSPLDRRGRRPPRRLEQVRIGRVALHLVRHPLQHQRREGQHAQEPAELLGGDAVGLASPQEAAGQREPADLLSRQARDLVGVLRCPAKQNGAVHHFQAGRGQQQAERRHGVVEHPGPGQKQLDQHVVDRSARIARLVGAVALPVIAWVVDRDRLGERSERVHGRKGTRLDHPLDPLGGVLDGVLLGQAAHLQGTAAQPQRQDRVVLERLQPALRAGQRGAGVSRQLLRAEGPAGADHATAGQRQPLVGQPRPQV